MSWQRALLCFAQFSMMFGGSLAFSVHSREDRRDDSKISHTLKIGGRFVVGGLGTIRKCFTVKIADSFSAVYLSALTRMGRHHHSQATLNVAYYLFVCYLVGSRPLLLGGFFRLVASLVLTCLIAFVVAHSSNIWRLLKASVCALPSCFFPWAVDRRWAEQSGSAIALPNEPNLSPLFQRPPPILSL
jgi:hypothetical protein